MKGLQLLTILFIIPLFCFGQTNPIKKYREPFSLQTQVILHKLDSLMCPDTLKTCVGTIESKHIGEASKISKLYSQYAELLKVASEKELLTVLDNPNELPAIRGYALMAYVYKCDKEKKVEKHFNYKFKTFIQIGCEESLYTYEQLYHQIRVRNFYDPNPHYFVKDSEEQKVIKQENKIRKEQGDPLRIE